MAGFFQDLLRGAAGGFFGSDYLRDYTHASKTFRPNFYQNTPKYKFLFHTYFDINQAIYQYGGLGGFGGMDNRQNLGLLVKEIALPNYVFDTSILNQYNRKRIIQNKIKYQPISITFHDDNAGQATKIWEAYYRYNYRDADKASPDSVNNQLNLLEGGSSLSSLRRNIYDSTNINSGGNWGFTGDAYNQSNRKPAFFNNIVIYGLSRKQFTKYTLVNPIITDFKHDTYNYDQGSGIMQNSMTVDYETVLYDYGAIDGGSPDSTVTNFGLDENYDRRLSPIAFPGSNRTILGQGGLVDGIGGVVEGLATGNILGAIRAAGTTYNTFKDVDLKETAKQELLNGVNAALTDPSTIRNLTAWVQQVGSTPSATVTPGAPIQISETSSVPAAGGQIINTGNIA
jgi:hypothetical protein